jgi:hypothetical protein
MDPTRPTADTCKKIIKHKQNKKNLKNKENSPKKRGNISSDTLVSALSELQGLLSISPEKKKSKIGSKKPKKKLDFFRAGTLCCALRNNN